MTTLKDIKEEAEIQTEDKFFEGEILDMQELKQFLSTQIEKACEKMAEEIRPQIQKAEQKFDDWDDDLQERYENDCQSYNNCIRHYDDNVNKWFDK
jgi:hypothetical protein